MSTLNKKTLSNKRVKKGPIYFVFQPYSIISLLFEYEHDNGEKHSIEKRYNTRIIGDWSKIRTTNFSPDAPVQIVSVSTAIKAAETYGFKVSPFYTGTVVIFCYPKLNDLLKDWELIPFRGIIHSSYTFKILHIDVYSPPYGYTPKELFKGDFAVSDYTKMQRFSFECPVWFRGMREGPSLHRPLRFVANTASPYEMGLSNNHRNEGWDREYCIEGAEIDFNSAYKLKPIYNSLKAKYFSELGPGLRLEFEPIMFVEGTICLLMGIDFVDFISDPVSTSEQRSNAASDSEQPSDSENYLDAVFEPEGYCDKLSDPVLTSEQSSNAASDSEQPSDSENYSEQSSNAASDSEQPSDSENYLDAVFEPEGYRDKLSDSAGLDDTVSEYETFIIDGIEYEISYGSDSETE